MNAWEAGVRSRCRVTFTGPPALRTAVAPSSSQSSKRFEAGQDVGVAPAGATRGRPAVLDDRGAAGAAGPGDAGCRTLHQDVTSDDNRGASAGPPVTPCA